MKKLFFKYGYYIPIVCVIIFTLTDIYSGDKSHWNRYFFENLITIGFGYQMFFFGIFHIFFGNKVSEFIGWEKNNPFQFEVGMSAIAMGVLGIACEYIEGSFWLATVIVGSVYLWGCVIGHIRDMIKNKNFNPGSSGFVFWWDLLMPVALILGYVYY